jgi:hypothetical protein
LQNKIKVNTTHSPMLGRLAEDLAIVKLSKKFENCIVSQVVNNQLHDLEIRRKDEFSTERICRIQVKSTSHKGRRSGSECYGLNIHHSSRGTKSYKQADVDFFLFFVLPELAYYVVPADAVGDKNRAMLYVNLAQPERRGSAIYEDYLEKWNLIGDFLGVSTKEGETIDDTLTKFM